MRAIDTNILVCLLTRDDQNQVELAEQFIEKGAWVSHLVLVETIWVLESVYNCNKVQLQSAITMLLQHEHLILQKPNVVEVALESFKVHKQVGFSDCLIIAVADNHGHQPLGTFDKKMLCVKGVVKP